MINQVGGTARPGPDACAARAGDGGLGDLRHLPDPSERGRRLSATTLLELFDAQLPIIVAPDAG